MTRVRIAVQPHEFDVAAELETLVGGDVGMGGVASFTGHVRGGGLTALTLEHWPGVTERALERLAGEAAARWPLGAITIVHRHGALAPAARIVLAAAASAHRAAALEAVVYLMDQLKTRAPFWKRESFADGTARWIEAAATDAEAAARW